MTEREQRAHDSEFGGERLRVLVVTWGSRGDVQPYMALAKTLTRRGHDVVLGASELPEYRQQARDHGVRFEGLGAPVTIPTLLDVGYDVHRIGDPLRQVRLILDRLLIPALESAYRRCLELGRDADVIVSHYLQPAGRMAAETLARPFITGTLVPLQIPSRHRPPRKMPNLGQLGNRGCWRLAGTAIDVSWGRGINRVRRAVGLPPLRNLVGDGFYSPKLNLVAASRHVSSPPADWAPRHRMTGYWFLDDDAYSPPPRVVEFLRDGPTPIAIGFGSMALPDRQALTRVLVEAATTAGVRAVIDGGWAGIGEGDLPASVLRADDVPHAWLLPRVAAFVHHGGAGTSAAAFRAGVPSVPIPHVFDHEYWAEQAWKFGVATRPIPRRRLTVDGLARAMRQAAGSTGMRARAAQLAQQVREEDGTDVAATMIETLARTNLSMSAGTRGLARTMADRPAAYPAGVT